MITRFASENLSINQVLSDFCLVLSVFHGVIWREEGVKIIPSGKYTPESLARALEKILSEERGFKVTIKHSKAGTVILYPHQEKVKLDRDLSLLLGIDQSLQEKNLSSRFTSLNNYLVHCDLLDKDENLFNGEPSSVLGCFDIAESQFKRVNYSPPNPVLRKITPRNDDTFIRIFVTDENRDIICCNGMPMKLELEII